MAPTPDAGMPTTSCYANGVKVSAGPVPGLCRGLPSLGEMVYRVEVTKADGSPCYSFEKCTPSAFFESIWYDWKDAAGNVVAGGGDGSTGSGFVQRLAVACEGRGTSAQCDYTFGQPRTCFCIDAFGRDGCGASAPPSTMCGPGTCP